MLAEQPPVQADAEPASEVRSRNSSALDDRVTPSQRRNLREELDSYSRKAYPDQETVNRRRRMMHDQMRERLSNPESGNISITRSEAQLRLPKLARHFDQIDTSHDGEITMDEINNWREQLKRTAKPAEDPQSGRGEESQDN